MRKGEEVYAFVDPKTKEIYLNPEFFATTQALEAPIHEYTHLGVIACEKINKPVYDRGMQLAMELLSLRGVSESGSSRNLQDPKTPSGESNKHGGVQELVDKILNDRVYSAQSREAQAQELLAQLSGKRGEEALRAETDKTVIKKIKSWLVEFWNGFGKALGLKDITPEEAERMTLEDVADAIRAEMLGGGKYGEGFKAVEFADGGARTATKPWRVKRRLTGRQKAVNEFVSMMGGGDDPTNTDTDLLALWVDNGGRLFDKMPFEVSTGYSKGKTGLKKTRSAVADEFAESTAFYKDLDAAQRKVFFGTEKLESGSIGESLREKLEAAGITRFTREDGTIDYEAAIEEFQRQWTNYERGAEFLKERGEYEEARDRAYVEEMERAEAAEREAVFGKDAPDALTPEEAAAQDAEIAADLAAGRFSRAQLPNGRDFVHVDVEQEQFDGKTPIEQQKIAKQAILKKFRNKIVGEGDNKAWVDKDSAGEYTHPVKRLNDQAYSAKMRTSTELDNLMATAKFKGHNPDDGRHPKAKGGWDHYEAIFEVGGRYYTGDVALMVDARGRRRLHDVTQIKEETLSQLTGSTQGHSAAPGISAREVLQGQNPDAGSSTGRIIPQTAAGAQGGVRWSRSGIFTGSAADYANHSRQGGKDDGPSLKKIGTGEGSQVYGWGLYGSTRRGVAEGYAKRAKAERNRKRTALGEKDALDTAIEAADLHRDLPNAKEAALDFLKQHAEHAEDAGMESIAKSYRDAYKLIQKNGIDGVMPREAIYEQTWFTNREPGDESHLLKWYEPVSEAQLKWIEEQAKKEGLDVGRDITGEFYIANPSSGGAATGENGVHPGYWQTAQNAYESLARFFGSRQAASEFLYRAGIDGVKYPVDSYGKTVKDGDKAGWNYVAFSDEHMRVDHKWRDGQMLFSRAVKPSALGDGKQRYYEVPFDKAVDKIVKNKKPVSDEHVFVGPTPQPFSDIGLPKLPIMMGQGHVISCYFGKGEGVNVEHLHNLKGKLKLLPKALERPLMIIPSESSPADSVVAIIKMQDATGASVIVPVQMSGVGRVGTDRGTDRVDAHIVLTMFGKKNAWKQLVRNAVKEEASGGVGIFYADKNEAKTILNRLAHDAPGIGRSELQSLSGSISKGTVHSIADDGSPVKGGIVSQTATRQFKNWFGKSKVVDANGEPLVVYRRDNDNFTVFDFNKTQQNDAGWLGKGFYFYGDKGEAERSTGYGKNLRAFYLKAENPYYITADEYNRLVEADDPKISAEFTERLKDEGYDSVYWNGDGRQEWMAFEPSQVKSATDNIGSFDPGNNDIRFSRGGAPEVEHVRLTRVADDVGQGEQTPGALAASAELSRTTPTPLTTKGTRYVALPVSEMVALTRYLNGHAESQT